jgi:hypothetical protein
MQLQALMQAHFWKLQKSFEAFVLAEQNFCTE